MQRFCKGLFLFVGMAECLVLALVLYVSTREPWSIYISIYIYV